MTSTEGAIDGAAGADVRPSLRAARLPIAAALAIGLAGPMPMVLTGALGVQLRSDLGFGPSALGAVVSIYAAVAAVFAVFLGGLADHLGWRRAMQLAAAVVGCSVVGVALIAHSWLVLAMLVGLGGTGHALGLPSGNLAIVSTVPTDRHALVLGMRQSAVPGAMILAGLSVPALALTVGWRWAFGLAAFVPLAAGVLARRGPVQEGRALGSSRPSFRLARPSMAFGSFVVVSLIGAGLVGAVSAFMVSGLVDSGVGEAGAGFLLMAGSAAALLTRVLAGLFVDYRSSPGFVPMAVLFGAGAVGFVMLALDSAALAPAGTVLAFAGGTGWAGLSHFVAVARNPGQAGAASGLLMTGGFTGGALGPVAFGFVAERLSFAAAWACCAVAAAAAASLVLLSRTLYARQGPG